MTDLISFLNARLDEDEAAARAALPIYGPGWRPENSKVAGLGPARIWGKDSKRPVAEAARRVSAAHITRHDPARVLREVAAKRAILAEHGPSRRDASRCRVCTAIAHTGMGHADARRFRAPCPTLLFLAAVYSDHPDYRAEWAVSPVG